MDAVNLDLMRKHRGDAISKNVIDQLEEMLNCTGLAWFDRTPACISQYDAGIVSVGWNVLGFPMTIYVTPDAATHSDNKRFRLWGQGGGIMASRSFHEDSDLIGGFDDATGLWKWLCEVICTPSNVMSLSVVACDSMGLIKDGISRSLLFDAWVRWAIESRQAYHFEDDPAQTVLTGSSGYKAFNAREVRQMHAIVRTAEYEDIDLCGVYINISQQIDSSRSKGWFQITPIPAPFPKAYGRNAGG